ncbi:MAG TPA: class I SAM-dependent methyltransferase [Blastocatellia bacterium]|nr:class I SAM-dependent methyltransferase [Blastocatellia bacterium]
MVDDISDIAQFYNSNPDDEQGRLEQHQLEYDLTWRYLQEYLPSRGAILEIGAATGRYTRELARRKYSVTAVDLSPALIERCRQNLAEESLEAQVRYVIADARNLVEVTGSRFDAVLLMGPLYHLIEEADRKLALKEAVDRLLVGGVLFSSFLSRFGVIGDLIKGAPHWIEDQEHVRSFIEGGKRPENFPRGGFRGYFARACEIASLHESLGLHTLVLAGVEPGISADDDSYNRLQGEQRQLWLNLLYKISQEESTLGASRHLLYIGKKQRE